MRLVLKKWKFFAHFWLIQETNLLEKFFNKIADTKEPTTWKVGKFSKGNELDQIQVLDKESDKTKVRKSEATTSKKRQIEKKNFNLEDATK